MSVGGFQFTKRTWLILILAVVAVVVIAAIVLSMQPSATKKSKESAIVTITILDSIGIDRITITNMDEGKSVIKTIIDLPYSFNCTRGDTIKTSTTMQYGFQYNAIEFVKVGQFDQHNPARFTADGDICINNEIIIQPTYIDLEISPTYTPTPTPSPSPSPTPTPSPEPTETLLSYTQLIVVK